MINLVSSFSITTGGTFKNTLPEECDWKIKKILKVLEYFWTFGPKNELLYLI